MDIALLAKRAQRLVAGLDPHEVSAIEAHVYEAAPDFEALSRIEAAYTPGSSPPSQEPFSWLGFVFSKPSLEAGRVHVHGLRTVGAGGEPELWLKLKRAEALTELWPEAVACVEPGAAVARALAKELGHHAVEFAPDLEVASGPSWLRTPIARGERVAIPTTQTGLDVAPRFRGLVYMKVPLG
jgi:hypothetical protein